jgi:hypothetical protein
LERYALSALEKLESKWVHETLDIGSEIQLLGDDHRALSIIPVRNSDKVVIVTLSFFVALAPFTTKAVRIKAVKAHLSLANLLYASGNMSEPTWKHIHKIWLAFLMELTFCSDKSENPNDDKNDDDERRRQQQRGLVR